MEKEQPLIIEEEAGFVKKMRERLDAHDEYTFQDFNRDWKLFKDGQIGTHDLFCKLVHVLYDDNHQDFLDDLKSFFTDSSASVSTASPLPGQSCYVN